MWVCTECGTLYDENGGGETCCGVELKTLEEAVETQLTLFELSGNERAQHVLRQLKFQYEASRLAVGKAKAKVATAIADADAALALLLDFYNLATDRDEPAEDERPCGCPADGHLADCHLMQRSEPEPDAGDPADAVPFEPDEDEIEQVEDEDAETPGGFAMTPAHEQKKSDPVAASLIYPAEAEVFVALARRSGGEPVALASDKRVGAMDRGDALEVVVLNAPLGVALATARTIFAAAGIEDYRDAGQDTFIGLFPAPTE